LISEFFFATSKKEKKKLNLDFGKISNFKKKQARSPRV